VAKVSIDEDSTLGNLEKDKAAITIPKNSFD
jgi:hypothetical protein